MKALTPALALGLGLGLAAQTASAGLVDFNPPEYPLGASLIVNPDWTNAGSGNLFTITSLGGGDGAAQSTTSAESAFSNAHFVPAAAFLGTPDTTTAGNAYDFSFQLRFDQIGGSDDFRLDHRIMIGGTDGSPIIAFDLFANSRLQYLTGSGSQNAVNVNGNALNLDDVGNTRFISVEGVIDVDAGTYDLTIDGVEQGTGLGLVNTPADFGQVTLQRRTGEADALQFSLDNLEIGLVPEPGTLGLAAIGSGLLMLRRR